MICCINNVCIHQNTDECVRISWWVKTLQCVCDLCQLSPVLFLSAPAGASQSPHFVCPFFIYFNLPSLPTNHSSYTSSLIPLGPWSPRRPPSSSLLAPTPTAALLSPTWDHCSSTLVFSILLCVSFLLRLSSSESLTFVRACGCATLHPEHTHTHTRGMKTPANDSCCWAAVEPSLPVITSWVSHPSSVHRADNGWEPPIQQVCFWPSKWLIPVTCLCSPCSVHPPSRGGTVSSVRQRWSIILILFLALFLFYLDYLSIFIYLNLE